MGALRFFLRIHISSNQGASVAWTIKCHNSILSPNCASNASYQSLSAYLGFNGRKPDGLVSTSVSVEEFPKADENIKIEKIMIPIKITNSIRRDFVEFVKDSHKILANNK
ncbi:unnamed protein product [Vicia faba]|uniref:Uncharacterized protein n=1 Tax=Vicia faba TaxID=3906 RepID=A0AAV0YWP8_VICFA|nr:unnamed protein product [Vicia faba]